MGNSARNSKDESHELSTFSRKCELSLVTKVESKNQGVTIDWTVLYLEEGTIQFNRVAASIIGGTLHQKIFIRCASACTN